MVKKKSEIVGNMKQCSSCEEWKEITDFSPKQSYCMECRAKKVAKLRKTAFEGLYRSCECAIARAKRTTGCYAPITCSFSSPSKFRKEIWSRDKFKKEWLYLWKRYEDSGYDPLFRPEIDRINPGGNYTIENIQFLCKEEHMIKDEHKYMIDVYYLNSSGEQYRKRISKDQAESKFPELEDVMLGGYGDGYLSKMQKLL